MTKNSDGGRDSSSNSECMGRTQVMEVAMMKAVVVGRDYRRRNCGDDVSHRESRYGTKTSQAAILRAGEAACLVPWCFNALSSSIG
ncbi:hypothetical protein E2C01_063396 [Portunus trituberculatus]|uniref:Uncharacterized protein n=1 Tax=Portunus trituberculatus TaxID=210409 RepID=A0A5B7H912_PORTR|nr:hypothetical protein [Portunus trituberculatus]